MVHAVTGYAPWNNPIYLPKYWRRKCIFVDWRQDDDRRSKLNSEDSRHDSSLLVLFMRKPILRLSLAQCPTNRRNLPTLQRSANKKPGAWLDSLISVGVKSDADHGVSSLCWLYKSVFVFQNHRNRGAFPAYFSVTGWITASPATVYRIAIPQRFQYLKTSKLPEAEQVRAICGGSDAVDGGRRKLAQVSLYN